MTTVNPFFAIDTGTTKDGQCVTSLFKTHWEYNGTHYPIDRPENVKDWYGIAPTDAEINHEILLNDWSRWNTELPKGQEVEISEYIFWELFGAVPPRNVQADTKYFECGECHHHEGGKAIHRACWIKDGKFYTGYPKTTFSTI